MVQLTVTDTPEGIADLMMKGIEKNIADRMYYQIETVIKQELRIMCDQAARDCVERIESIRRIESNKIELNIYFGDKVK